MSRGRRPDLCAVLFDLDGTLLDTAPDLVGALNHLRQEEGLPPVPVSEFRRFVSRGALGLIREGLPDRGAKEEARRRQRFLDWYAVHSLDASGPFPGVETLLATLDEDGIAWGIVTNKPTFLTQPIIEAIGWSRRAQSVVCRDTLAVSKPHPDPVLKACRDIGVDPVRAAMVGDDPRDLDAGEAAGCLPVLAAYGYGAEEVVDSGREIPARIETPEGMLGLFQDAPRDAS